MNEYIKDVMHKNEIDRTLGETLLDWTHSKAEK
jgi:hypothetical protein